MLRFVAGLIGRMLLVGLLTTGGTAALAQSADRGGESAVPVPPPNAHLEQLLNEAGFRMVERLDNGQLKVLVEGEDGEYSFVYMFEQEMSWTDNEGNKVKVAFAYRPIVGFPPGFEVPVQLYQKVCEFNSWRMFGHIDVIENGLFLSGSTWLSTVSPNQLSDMLYLFHNDGEHYEAELAPFVSAGEEEVTE